MLDLATALIGPREIGIEIIGIRPGEKLHEILVSEEEAHHCVDRGSYYAILPMLPELLDPNAREPNALTKEFSSGDVVLDLEGTVALLRKNRLTVEDVELNQDEELLR
jgi:UDP-glucose 4-epimerase